VAKQITIHYLASDRTHVTRRYVTLEGARKYAHLMVGETPERGSYYAISGDGIGRITVSGCTLDDLFPKTVGE
jgi:hypothetical protein